MVSNRLPPCGLGSWRSTITTSGEKEVANVRAAGPSVVALTEKPRVRNAAEATRRNSRVADCQEHPWCQLCVRFHWIYLPRLVVRR